jgi:hypothetical protein
MYYVSSAGVDCVAAHSLYTVLSDVGTRCFAGACQCQAAYNNDRHLLSTSVIEDVQSVMKTLNSLQNHVYNIEQEQRSVLRILARETKYGSK